MPRLIRVLVVRTGHFVDFVVWRLICNFPKFSDIQDLVNSVDPDQKEHSDQSLHCLSFDLYEPGHEKTCLTSYTNNKGADQTAHPPRSLISTFVVCCLDSVMSLVSVTKISSLMLASVGEQAGLSLTWSETPEDTFCHDAAHIFWTHYSVVKPILKIITAKFVEVWMFFYLYVNVLQIGFVFQDSHKHVVESGIFEGEFDDEFLVPTKAPPPYPGSESPGRSIPFYLKDYFVGRHEYKIQS